MHYSWCPHCSMQWKEENPQKGFSNESFVVFAGFGMKHGGSMSFQKHHDSNNSYGKPKRTP